MSLENYASAEAVVRLATHLLEKEEVPAKDVVTLCFCSGHCAIIKRMMRQWPGATVEWAMDAATVDKYQANEKSIVLVDFVTVSLDGLCFVDAGAASAGIPVSRHAQSRHSIYVAITRGQDGLIIFGTLGRFMRELRVSNNADAVDNPGNVMEGLVGDIATFTCRTARGQQPQLHEGTW